MSALCAFRRLRRHWLVGVVFLACAGIVSGRAADAPPAPLVLDGEWRFQLAPDAAAAERLAAFHTEGFDAAAFRPIPVPATWVLHGFEEPHYVDGTVAEGFYLHRFAVPAAVAGRRALLRFGGVWQSAEVWLNGRLLGRHDGGFTAFAFDVTEALAPGAENRLAVRVRQRTPLFRLDTNDDWAMPGIYRNVTLEFTPKELFFENVEVVTALDPDYRGATLRLRAFVMRDAKADFFAPSPPFEVRAVLRTRAGVEVQRAGFTGVIAGSHNGRDVPLALRVAAPALWTAETPALYDAEIELVQDGTVVHRWQDRIGFREVSTQGGVLRINGQAVKLRGVCRHEEHPDVGRATRPQDWLEDIRLMKAGNINAVRTAHYPPAEGFLRLCDELGLYVIDEIPYGFGGDRLSDPAYTAGAFQRVQETVARDRNRPSVIVWSLGNEDPFSTLHLAALRALKGLDPTRPVLLPFRAEEWMPPEVDILAPHYWKAADYDALAARATRPVITTENSHALGPEDFGEVQERWDALTQHAAGAGAMVWMWADQGLRRPTAGRTVLDPMLDKARYTREGAELVREKDAGPGFVYDSHGNMGTDGIVDADRAPQRDYWELKAVYAPVRVLAERVDFRAGQPSVVVPVRNDHDFTDLAAVRVTWKLFRDATELAAGVTRLAAAPHTTALLTVPTSALAAVPAGAAAYVVLSFADASGREVVRRSVRLGDYVPAPVAAEAAARPIVRTIGDETTVTAGGATYTFDAKRGGLAAIEVAGVRVAQGADLVVWRPSTYCERNVLDRRPAAAQHAWATYLQGLTPTVRNWTVGEADGGVRVTATVVYREDEKNSFAADVTYVVRPVGALQVGFTVTPQVDVDALTEIGFELRTAGKLEQTTWLGQGMISSLPNRRAATQFGVWSARSGTPDAQGTKSDVRWLELGFGRGAMLRVSPLAGFRVDGTAGEQCLRLLTHLAGAWVKGGPPERPEWRLDVAGGRRFTGEFEIWPVTPQAGRQ